MLIKIKIPCEFNGMEYDGVVLVDGVNADVGPGCDPLFGNVITFSKGKSIEDGGEGKTEIPAPVLFVSALQSASVGEGIPPSFLVLTPGDDE